jgi:ABC-type spermidine/putrescine transport system permease subunit II
MSQKTRQERNLGWKLVAPAFLVMMAVVLYPILNAFYLSLFNYRLTDASARTFIWLTNYRVILIDSAWWDAVWVSTIIMVASIAIEFPFGLALAMVMNKVVIPRRTLRTVVLIPYSIITVVSAYGWQYAFQPSSGFISPWLHDITFGAFNSQYDWFGHHWPAMVAVLFSEVWKTTPFHVIAALGRLGAGTRRAPGGSRSGWRNLLGTAAQGHVARHEGRYHDGAALPSARRLPHIRQHLHHDKWLGRDDVSGRARLLTDHHPKPDRAWIRTLDPPFRSGLLHRIRIHQGVQNGHGQGKGRLSNER